MDFVKDLVSVIIPVYNAEKFLQATLHSVINQTYKNIEIVIVDDCSTDNSAEIIRHFISNQIEIVYYLQDKNRGAGAARNKALELARGQYVAFLDSDDIWLFEKIERQISLMKEKRTGFCYAAIEMIDENNQIVKTKRKIKETCDYHYLLRNTIIATSTVIIDRIILGDFKMPLRRGGQDYATWLMLLRNGEVAYGINEVMSQYRLVSGSLSSNKLKSIKQVWEIQTQDEKIGKGSAALNVIGFVLNAVKKYWI
nr:glycosyltransferase family 2 protein [uncultured Sphaerochaeta sp.]